MKKQITIIILALLSGLSGFAQKHKKSGEICIFVGGSYYIGDLNQTKHFLFTKPAAGFAFRYNLNYRVAIRAGAYFGSIEGYDSFSNNAGQKQRNLSFKSQLFDVSAIGEFNFFNYRIGSEKQKFTPYIFLGIGMFRFNPQGQLKNNWVALQPLSTEGEGLDGGSKGKPYKLLQISVPFGIGFRTNLSRKIGLSIEWGMRKTFTDYLDDVSGRYYDPNKLAVAKGPEAAQLSDPSKGTDPGKSNVGLQRGNSTTKDWYCFVGMIVSFQMRPKKERCPSANN